MMKSLGIYGNEDPLELLQKGHLTMAFQPIVKSSGDVYGFEALLRGTDAIPIPCPEDLFSKKRCNGSLIRLDMACIGSALRSGVKFTQRHKLFINIHAETLTYLSKNREAFFEFLKTINIPCGRIIFEISERTDTACISEINGSLEALLDSGIQIAIDDVYSDFLWLKHMLFLKPAFLKIDKSLIRGINKSLSKKELLRILAWMSQNRGIRMIAEGVEDEETFDLLKDYGIPLVQGFLLGRPEPVGHWNSTPSTKDSPVGRQA